MKILGFTAQNGEVIGIPARKITGFTSVSIDRQEALGKCFIATGADGADGGENGWYVQQSYQEVRKLLECIPDA